jgi:CBS domain-containing protein
MNHGTILAKDIMGPLRTVTPATPIRELAQLLVDDNLDGVCVVDDPGGRLVGVVTAMDLVFQEKRIKGPAIFWLIDSPVVLGQSRFQHDLQKQTGTTVQDVMSPGPTTVTESTGIDEIATLMVDNRFTILPVLRDETPVGMITKWDVLRRVLAHQGA